MDENINVQQYLEKLLEEVSEEILSGMKLDSSNKYDVLTDTIRLLNDVITISPINIQEKVYEIIEYIQTERDKAIQRDEECQDEISEHSKKLFEENVENISNAYDLEATIVLLRNMTLEYLDEQETTTPIGNSKIEKNGYMKNVESTVESMMREVLKEGALSLGEENLYDMKSVFSRILMEINELIQVSATQREELISKIEEAYNESQKDIDTINFGRNDEHDEGHIKDNQAVVEQGSGNEKSKVSKETLQRKIQETGQIINAELKKQANTIRGFIQSIEDILKQYPDMPKEQANFYKAVINNQRQVLEQMEQFLEYKEKDVSLGNDKNISSKDFDKINELIKAGKLPETTIGEINVVIVKEPEFDEKNPERVLKKGVILSVEAYKQMFEKGNIEESSVEVVEENKTITYVTKQELERYNPKKKRREEKHNIENISPFL